MTTGDAGLPSAADARCRLALDLALQIHGLFELAGLRGLDEEGFTRRIREGRDARLLKRLEDVLPPDELLRAFSADRFDLADLADRVPAVHPIWVMTTAVAVHEAAEVVDAQAAKPG